MTDRDAIIAQLSTSTSVPCLVCRVVRVGDVCPACRLAFDGYVGRGLNQIEAMLASLSADE